MTLRIGLVQPTTGLDPAVEARALAAAVASLTGQGAQVIFMPEMSGLVDRDRRRATTHIVAEDGDAVLAAVCTSAKIHKVWVHLGSLALKGPTERFVNRGFLIDDSGEIRARYDKIHLFDVTLPGGPRLAVRRARGDQSRRPFLLVHGLASNARLWDGVATALADSGREVAAVDLLIEELDR